MEPVKLFSHVVGISFLFQFIFLNSKPVSAHYDEMGIQPLSKIAIHKATVEHNDLVKITAHPRVLGLKGEDFEWVQVKLENRNSSQDDWIGVFSPAVFNGSNCHSAGDGGRVKAPFICSAPIKYKFANHSKPNYVKTGRNVFKFRLINQRADFSFALFTGGLSNPKLVAVSGSITFANPKAPVYPRLALGKSWDEMTVTWTSGYNIDEATPFVEWGLIGENQIRSAAGTLTFGRSSMCGKMYGNGFSDPRRVHCLQCPLKPNLSATIAPGLLGQWIPKVQRLTLPTDGSFNSVGAPARTVGWRDPGFMHTSFLKDTWPSSRYTYKIGHRLVNGSYIWSKMYSFISSPYPGQDSLQRVIIFGDSGKAERDGSNEYTKYQAGSLNTTDTLINDLDNIDIVFHIGDMAYANGYISQWDQFTEQMGPIASSVPYMVASGNHERDWANTGSFYSTDDSGAECGVPAETMYYVPAENRAKFWYPADFGMFHFCIADTEHDWREGSEQYKFIERCLASADRQKQPWLIFAAHRVLGYSSNAWYASEGSFAEPMGRDDMEKLWQKYKVDIAFYGHVHNYERICPIYQNQCVSSEKSHFSGTVNGTIHVVVGGGGSQLSQFTTIKNVWSVFKDEDFGFGKMTAFNHSHLLFEYKKSSDGNVYDSFTISRDYRDVLACVHDGCEPTTLAS